MKRYEIFQQTEAPQLFGIRMAKGMEFGDHNFVNHPTLGKMQLLYHPQFGKTQAQLLCQMHNEQPSINFEDAADIIWMNHKVDLREKPPHAQVWQGQNEAVINVRNMHLGLSIMGEQSHLSVRDEYQSHVTAVELDNREFLGWLAIALEAANAITETDLSATAKALAKEIGLQLEEENQYI